MTIMMILSSNEYDCDAGEDDGDHGVTDDDDDTGDDNEL